MNLDKLYHGGHNLQVMRECDILVVGAGLSGVSAANHLSRLGEEDVVVLERLSDGPFNRYHRICGEAVSDRMFNMAGFEPSGIIRRVDRICIAFPGDIEINIPVSGQIVDRPSLISNIRDGCSADFVHATARGVTRDGDGFIVGLSDGSSIRCNKLVGADGAHSVVRRDVFGHVPQEVLPIVNNIVPGTGDGSLRFEVGGEYPGAYKWEFPSSDGMLSVGYIKGCGSVEGAVETGARNMVIGIPPSVVDGSCILVGDAACLANPLCFGGIGVALVSGRKAAEALSSGDVGRYQRWVDRDLMFDPHFMEAHKSFSEWGDEEISTAMEPFRKGYSLARGLMAMIRHPKWANIYFSCWIGFKRGW